MGMPLVGFLLVIIGVDVCASPVLGSSVTVAPSQRRPPWQYINAHSVGPGQHLPVQAEPASSPNQAPSGARWKRHGNLDAAPPNKAFHISSSGDKPPPKVPHQHTPIKPTSISVSPSVLPSETHEKKWVHGPAYAPYISTHKRKHERSHFITPKAAYPIAPPTHYQTGPSISPLHSPSPLSTKWGPLAPSLAAMVPAGHFTELTHPPAKSPAGSPLKIKTPSPPLQTLTLPPPPPNENCTPISCLDPLTYAPPGSPCGCVWPLQVKIQLSTPIYTFFSLVTELAEEIAASVSLNHGQVRIMGANAASQQLDKSTVLVNLVPRGEKFDGATALSIYKKFWNKQVSINDSIFGAYEVLYVHYPGLPPSPPSASSSISITDDEPYPGGDNNGRMNKPLGVNVKRQKKEGLHTGMITVIVLSCLTALSICLAVAWLLLIKCRTLASQDDQIPQAFVPTSRKQSGIGMPMIFQSIPSSASMSFSSGALTYTGTAKTFSLIDIERATNDFDASKILGEGGFGVVYSGMLEDGRVVAVKVLKRDDQHGTREFLAEVEMLSRLHHRNLVKLIGICTEGHTRCLVYELIPNGSVESHLHGVDKETGPLDWDARMKIALGAARALAYLHEDSSPRVIHRDFKSSNILLEYDFTPKVSDFGLARAAVDEANKHISTHVMGTFGYLAPEYAMTGHLLVKSDVYSYGVVLLELLTGRKPVDLSQPPGQENFVGYARPLLTSKEGLESIIDPAIRSAVSLDTVAKVAAIASMCLQPEVSHRPFMGEVVQALKLVCNEFDETDMRTSRHQNLLIDLDSANIRVSGETMEVPMSHPPLLLSTSDLLIASVGTEEQEFGSSRRHSTSGPLRTRGRMHFWQRLRSLSRGSSSEHGFSLKLWPGTS